MKKELRELIVLLTDAYKLFHRQMYPKNTITVYSNGTPRSSKHYKGNNKDEVVVFGTQRLVRLLKDKFQIFFDLPEGEVMEFCKQQLSSFTGTDYDIEHLRYLHKLQYLPLVIKSLPEGTKCPIKVPYMTFYNTDSKCFWLTNYLETFISAEIWHFITNATIANEYREIFDKHAIKTVGNNNFVSFQGHDFSMRGMYGIEAARSSGLAHLSSFCGSDTIPSYLDAQYYYDAKLNDWVNFDITATSVPASEHSVQCAHFNSEDGNELVYLDAILDEFPEGIISIVCDGYDFWKFITKVAPQRKERILARNGKVVFRPDSGNIVDIICGTYQGSNYQKLENRNNWIAQEKGAIEVLADIFGTTETEKDYKLLNEKVGLIYGDSVTLQIADEVCKRLSNKGFASINWVAGIGSYTYQFNTRDSHGQAIKATYVEFEEIQEPVSHDGLNVSTIIPNPKKIGKAIFKDPKTGDGMKKSAKGLLKVDLNKQMGLPKYELHDEVSWEEEKTGALQEIFRDGELKNQTTLTEIRERLKN